MKDLQERSGKKKEFHPDAWELGMMLFTLVINALRNKPGQMTGRDVNGEG